MIRPITDTTKVKRTNLGRKKIATLLHKRMKIESYNETQSSNIIHAHDL